MRLLGSLFPAKNGKKKKLTHAQEREIADRGRVSARRALAQNERTSQEILYYLADKDPSAKVRKAVAENPSTPLQATPILARDPDKDVRLALARRLVTMLPSLSGDRYSQLYAFAVQSLGTLALDEVIKIRRALTETLKDHVNAPPAVALQLARDLEREVSEPILRFCAALGDDDLIDILEHHPANWAAEAIAGRKALSSRVSQAVINTGNVRAGEILLSNEGAKIGNDVLLMIVERAREYPEWHKPLAIRKELSSGMALKLAEYVDVSVRKLLEDRADLDSETIKEIVAIVQRRVAFEAERRRQMGRGKPLDRARMLYKKSGITEEVMNDALAMHDYDFAKACLALLLNTPVENIEKVFDAKAPKSICAICWRAGFSMRLAFRLQQAIGHVRAAALIYPRGGTDYPLTPDEMRWQLDFIGIQ